MFGFTDSMIDRLKLRLRQSTEELLYDVKVGRHREYLLTRKPESKILGVAHCDYVSSAWSYPSPYDDGRKIRAGQVDDRVGVWILLDVLPALEGMPSFDVLLTDDEECGRSTAQHVREDLAYNWTFQFDRRGTDFVDYDLASKEFVSAFRKITKIRHSRGSFSDICYLPRSCQSRVNVGCGYYDEHTTDAHVDLKHCSSQVAKFVKFAQKMHETEFPLPANAWIRGESRSYQGYYGNTWSSPKPQPPGTYRVWRNGRPVDVEFGKSVSDQPADSTSKPVETPKLTVNSQQNGHSTTSDNPSADNFWKNYTYGEDDAAYYGE